MALSTSNPPNRFASSHVTWDEDETPSASLELTEEHARSMLSKNESPDLPFVYGVNPYRGCTHACAYCYARPYHEYWGLGAGTDFDRKITVKINAASVLREELAREKHHGQMIVFSGATDAYQGIESRYRLTRACLEVCRDLGASVSIVTKSALVVRDIDVLVDIAAHGDAEVFLSIPFPDDARARAMEPFATRPGRRFDAIRALSEAGIPTGVSLSPVIPGLNDDATSEILTRAREAGATRAFMNLVRLPGATETVFKERLRAAFPDRADKVLRAISEMRGGSLTNNRFGERMRGHGPRWTAIEDMFKLKARKLGFDVARLTEVVAERAPRRIEPENPPEATRPSARRSRADASSAERSEKEPVPRSNQLRLFDE